MIPRNRIVEKIRLVYEKYGFSPIDTPILESTAVLLGTGGEETNKEIFTLESPEGEQISLRFDLTVPFARFLAQYRDRIKLPFRRYHIGPAFRADKPDPGRFRQFTQFDIDAAGCESVAVDAEIVAAMCEAFSSLGLTNDGMERREYAVSINDRKLIDCLLAGCGIASMEVQKHVLRVIDKLQKVGLENVRKELGEGRVDDSGDPIQGVGLEPSTIDRVLDFISIKGETRQAVVDTLSGVIPGSDATELAIQEFQDLADSLASLGVGEGEATFEPSLARGLDYYTGPVFEAVLPAAAQFGSVMGGGRYDNLVARFLNEDVPATGATIGIDRLVVALGSMGKIESLSTPTRVLVVGMKGVPHHELLKAAKELRDEGIPTETYLGAREASMKHQMSYANSKDIPVAIIFGSNEIESNQASIKDLSVGKEERAGIGDHEEYQKAGRMGQVTVNRADMVRTVKEILEA
jgi:histidyl-tRNA synthetase